MSILITGSRGMLGSNILAQAQRFGLNVLHPLKAELDLRHELQIEEYFRAHDIEAIIHCAARVGGISAQIEKPADFILENLVIDSNLLSTARDWKIQKLIYFGSSCMYPRDFRQPLVESDILAGPLEPTNESYALAKISAARAVTTAAQQDGLTWRVLIPSNLYGPGDNFDPASSHLVASLINKVLEAKDKNLTKLEIWGDGKARREFTYVEDIADFVITNLNNISDWELMMNIGAGEDHSILEYYEMVCKALSYNATFTFNLFKPTGMTQKLMSSSIARQHGWSPSTTLAAGLSKTITWKNLAKQNG
jgi:GDP-L-fucose synthase